MICHGGLASGLRFRRSFFPIPFRGSSARTGSWQQWPASQPLEEPGDQSSMVLFASDRRSGILTNDGLLSFGLGLLFDDFLMLCGDEELSLFGLHELVVSSNRLGYLGLGHSNGLNVQPRRDHCQLLLQRDFQVLVNVGCERNPVSDSK